ncbi:metal-sensing transcriptional repressor [Vagococcus carniphilus]|uniref:Metal-sensing transcriptional repressor n=1 Tax=Vagococcus carniphilus TaxID=218144 RepID=A0AAW8U9B8_9ENTE|nr:metal-sensing transcriptional repressor [Vagococcus carniphilus]MDT2815946.1 metal-sensing transcriptional repressor [Vagococcus carniphilus]MDT2834417.1 metal-sensing transcriptional repressor [Vagococcus carniphilus]
MTGSKETKKKIENRLKRSEGQIRGVLKMLEEDKDCRDVVIQLSAIRSSIDRAIGVIVAENLKDCLAMDDLSKDEKEEKIKEAIELVVKK